ncbi:MAG: GGDEF domain-containing protein [Bacillota bacterium]
MCRMNQDINRISFFSHFITIITIVALNSWFKVIPAFTTVLIVAAILFSLYLNIQHSVFRKTSFGQALAVFIAVYYPVMITLFISLVEYQSIVWIFIYFLTMLRNPYLSLGASVVNGLVSVLCFVFVATRIFHLNTFEIIFGSIIFSMAAVLSWVLNQRLWMFEQQSMRDGLTGLKNYRSLNLALRQEIGKCLEEGRPCSILMIDIDNFKKYNDKMGHVKGDRTLREVAKIMSSNMRDSDMIFRYGGEEFCALLPGVGQEKTKSVAERIRGQVEEAFAQHDFPVTVSIGISSTESGIKNPRQLLEEADKALYKAKILKNRVVAF